MNLAAPNSPGSAALPPPSHSVTVDVLLPDGSCIPATLSTVRQVLKQARSAALKVRKARRQEIADELQQNLEDRAAARRLLDELASYDRDRRRMAATLRAKVRPEPRTSRVSGVTKRRTSVTSFAAVTPQRASSWVVDDLGLRGVSYHQSYLSRKSPAFYRGAARDRWFYDVRDEAVARDAEGEAAWFSNLGEDVEEVGAAWQAIEDATVRKNGKVQIRIIVPLDADAFRSEQADALRLFCETVLAPMGLPYSAVLHDPPAEGDQRNTHGHILTNLRPLQRVAPYTWSFADEVRGELDGKNGVQMLRHLWAHAMSEAAERAGRNMRYTGLSYAARGLSLEAGEHLGEARAAMVARGETVWAHERNRLRLARNAQRLILSDLDRKMAALGTLRESLVAERDAETRPARKILVGDAPRAEPFTGLRPTSSAAASVIGAAAAGKPLSPAARVIVPSDRPGGTAGQIGSRPTSLQPVPAPRAIEQQALAPAGERECADAPAILVPASIIDAHVPTPTVVETMREVVRRLAKTRRAKEADPTIAALHRRRALLEESDRRRADLQLRERLWLELNPLTASTRAARDQARVRDRERLERIAKGGGYVAAREDGVLVQPVRDSGEPMPDDQWWTQRHVQRLLSDLRRRQQEVVAQALRAHRLDPAPLLGGGVMTWEPTVEPVERARLRRWATSPAFRADVVHIAGRIAAEPEDKGATPAPAPHLSRPSASPSRIADGFGGWRDTPRSNFSGVISPVRLSPFMPGSGAPTEHLLRLLAMAGEHPHDIEVASDGKLMSLTKRPKMLAPLLHSWRHDDRVAALVVETVRRSREAGRAVWPESVAAAVDAFVSKEARRGRAHQGRPPKRRGAHSTRAGPGDNGIG